MKNYIQIGSNIGNDHFFDLCKELKDKSNIYLIEPNPELIPILKNNYASLSNKHNIYVKNCGIVTPKIKNVNKLYLYKDLTGQNISGLSSILVRKSHPYTYSVVEFIPITFDELCNEFNIVDVEMLSIDTEGLDYEILNNIDLSKININSIIFEFWPYENDDVEEKVETGSGVLDKLKKKYFDYTITQCSVDNQQSFKMEKIK